MAYVNPRTAEILRQLANSQAIHNAKDDQLKSWAIDVGYSRVMESNCPSWLKGWMSRETFGCPDASVNYD